MYQNILIGVGMICTYFIINYACARNTNMNKSHIMFKGSYYPH